MTIFLEAYTIPEKGKVELKVDRSFEITVTAAEARRKVNRWLLNEVSYLIGADPPTLVVGEHVAWRVPAWIGFPHTGRVGVVGTVDVDVQTGDMENLAERKLEIEQNLEKLKPNLPSYKPRSPEEGSAYLAKDVPSAPKLIIAEAGYFQIDPQSEED
jgi:hypothetical protein